MASRSNPYPYLSFYKNVDWQHVDPTLLQTLNSIGKTRGVVIDIFSGYRSDSYSEKVGGFAGDPHTQGIAVDAYVNGQPIGKVITASTFKQAGLITGNQPNFYKGKPDPEHVQLADASPYVTDSTTGMSAQQQPQQQAPTAQDKVLADSQSYTPAPGPPVSGAPLPGLPGSAALDPASRYWQGDTWRLLAQLPGASPDTLRLSQMAAYGDPNASS